MMSREVAMTLRARPATAPSSYRRPSHFRADLFPPLLAVGPGVDPYPDDLVEPWLDGRHPRRLAGVEPAALGLRGIARTVATRDRTGMWTVHADAIRQLASRVGPRGMRDATIEISYSGDEYSLENRIVEGSFRKKVETFLNDAAWYAPHTMPPLTAAVSAALTTLLTERFPERGRAEPLTEQEYYEAEGMRDDPMAPSFTADRLESLVDSSTSNHDYSRLEWRDRYRKRQAWIDQSIAATGRIAPYRLRPIVVITRNAGAREWAYKGWAMYDASVDAGGALLVGPIIAVWGYARSGYAEWVRIDYDRIPTFHQWTEEAIARLRLAQWYGWDHTWWARIHCAVSGEILYPTERGQVQSEAPNVEALVPEVPVQSEVRDLDMVL